MSIPQDQTPMGPGWFIFFQGYSRGQIPGSGLVDEDDDDDVALALSLLQANRYGVDQ